MLNQHKVLSRAFLVSPLRALRIANPIARAVLRSRAHALLSARLVVVGYEGRLSGRTFAIPVRYAELAEGRLVAIAAQPAHKLWWRSFVEPREATLELRGARVLFVGRVARGTLRDEATAAYRARYPRSANLLLDAELVVFTRKG